MSLKEEKSVGKSVRGRVCSQVCQPSCVCVFVCHQSLLSICNTYLLLSIKGNGMIHLLQIISSVCQILPGPPTFNCINQRLNQFLEWRWGAFFLWLSSDWWLLSAHHLIIVSEFLITLFLTVYLSKPSPCVSAKCDCHAVLCVRIKDQISGRFFQFMWMIHNNEFYRETHTPVLLCKPQKMNLSAGCPFPYPLSQHYRHSHCALYVSGPTISVGIPE